MKTCSECGSENRDGAAFCSKCGSELPHEDGIKGWWKRQNRSSKFLIITPFAILVLILLLGAFTEPSGYSDVNYDDATVYDNDAADVSGASSTKTFGEAESRSAIQTHGKSTYRMRVVMITLFPSSHMSRAWFQFFPYIRGQPPWTLRPSAIRVLEPSMKMGMM